MKTRKIIGGLGLIAIAGLGGLTVLENVGPTKYGCEVYRGEGLNLKGDAIEFVFDSSRKEYREGRTPQYTIQGDEEIKNQLKIGTAYCFDYTNPIVGSPKRLRNLEQH